MRLRAGRLRKFRQHPRYWVGTLRIPGLQTLASLPYIAVQIAFDSTPLTAAPTWTDITADVLLDDGLTIRRGRSSELESASAGTLTFTVRNADRRYDPNYSAGAASPYAGKLLPRKQVRVLFTWAGVTYNVWRGHVQAITQGYDISNRWATATFDCVDAFNLFATMSIGSAWEATVLASSPDRWYRFDETSGLVAYEQILPEHGNHEGTTLGADPLVNGGVASASYAGSAVTRLHNWVPGTSGSIEFWINVPAADATKWMVIYNAEGMGVYINTDGTLSLTFDSTSHANSGQVDTPSSVVGATHHIAFTWDNVVSSFGRLYVDGSQVATNQVLGNAGKSAAQQQQGYIGLPWTGTVGLTGRIDELVFYDFNPSNLTGSYLDATAVANHHAAGATAWTGDTTGTRLGRYLDAINWPAALRTIDTGSSTVQAFGSGANSLLSDMQDLEATEQGVLVMGPDGKVVFQGRQARINTSSSAYTFGDTGTDLPYHDLTFDYGDTELRNDATFSSQGQVTQHWSDVTSITAYGKRTYSRSTIDDTTGALLSGAQWIVDRFKNPITRVTQLAVRPQTATATLWPATLTIDVGTRLTVNRTPQGVGSAFSQDVFVEGISHQFSSGQWETTFFLTPADTRPYWVLGTSTLNTDSRLAF